MNRKLRGLTPLLFAGGIAALALPRTAAAAAAAKAEDKTLSPYFYIPGGKPGADELPLESTDVDVSISGAIADVTVRQTYKNEGSRPLSAQYVFPASTRAAVHGLKMKIGDHVIEAVVKEKKEARETFEKARKEGKSASLLEQKRPNVFSMNVANIMPGDRIQVELEYTELLVPTAGTYEFVYPTVVGPRYSEQTEATAGADDRWVESPYLSQGEAPTYSFGLSAAISSAIPIQELSSPSHAVEAAWDGKKRAEIDLADSEKAGGNRDFILRYRLAGRQVSSGLMLYEGEKEKFFLLMVEPPERVAVEKIPPREYVFILDVSGSMHGFPLDTAKALMRELAGKLRPTDTFNVILFSGGSHLMFPRSVPATSGNVNRALRSIDRVRGGGGTRLLSALERAMSLPHPRDASRSFVVVTDGYISAEADVFGHIKDHLGSANVFSFGIGTSVNRYLIEGIAKAGMGEPFAVTDPAESDEVASRFVEYIRSPVLTNIDVEFESFKAYDVSPKSVPDVLAERPVIVQGKWTGDPNGTITLAGVSGEGKYKESFDVSDVEVSDKDRALAYLWARSRIAELSDFASPEQKERARDEITALGLAYNLLTRHTSFVAVHDVVRNKDKDLVDVQQPLPLPQGVGNRAVGGGSVGVGSEPELWLLLMLAVAMAMFFFARGRARA